MIFGDFTCADALGVRLAHTLHAGGRTLRKGRILDADDLAALAAAGVERVAGARLAATDVAEDDAAGRIAQLLAGSDCAPRQPYTGRCNIHASVRGIVRIDAAAVDRLNAIDEAITVATLPPWTLVRRGQVIASVKIIPFAIDGRLLAASEAAIAAPPLALAPLHEHRVGLVVSAQPGAKDKAAGSAATATRKRVEALGSRLALDLRCRHEPAAIEAAVRRLVAAGCNLILVSGATVAKDRGDVVPAAIVRAGGTIERVGMPVEPGNMLVLARLAGIPVVVLPGCARSLRHNGLDWVLQRLLAHLPLSAADIAAMGVGGLIRNGPAEAGGADEEPEAPPPRSAVAGASVAALVLAAGRSSRMGGSNKLLATVDGVPLVRRAVDAALASRASSVTVVTGHDGEAIAGLVGGPGVACVHNADYADGMATSLRCGLAALPADADAAIVLLADMPRIDAGHIDRLIDAYAAHPGIVVPLHDGRRGNPVVWPRRHFAAMQAIAGDRGARELLVRHADEVHAVDVASDAIFADVDTPDALAALNRPQEKPG